MHTSDPTAAARQWLADNPGHEAEPHVRAAFESADRHEMLAQETAACKPGETRVVIAGIKPGPTVVITATGIIDEGKIASLMARYLALLIQGAKDRHAAGALAEADARAEAEDADHVWLTAEPQDHRIVVVKALRAVTDLGLAEAKRIALDGESGFPVCLTGGIHRVGTDVDPKVRLPVEVRTLHRGRKELAATLAALGVPHHVGARPPVPRLPGAAEYEARATSREDSRAQLCDALGLPGLTWDEALAEVRRRGGSGEQG